MINHARTLLLNRNGFSRPPATYFGEEFVPEDFNEVDLPSFLVKVRSVLFGENPDNAGMNYQVKNYVSLLHSTEFVQYVTALDDRITYDVLRDEMGGLPTVTITPLSLLCSDMEVSLVGETTNVVRDWALDNTWNIEVMDIATVQTDKVGGGSQGYQANYASGSTDLIPLTGSSDMFVRITSSLPNLVAGAKWTLNSISLPTQDIPGVLAKIEDIGEEALINLFGLGPEEPYSTFRDLWARENLLAYRMAGLLLAVIYRTEEVRSGG